MEMTGERLICLTDIVLTGKCPYVLKGIGLMEERSYMLDRYEVDEFFEAIIHHQQGLMRK